MVLRWLTASLHLLALPIGLGAVWARSRAFKRLRGPDDLHSVFVADNFWGLAAGLWIATGLVRLLAGLEKSTSYYLHDWVFLVKMGLLVVILLLEIWPMSTLIRWRMTRRRGGSVNTAAAPILARISQIQAILVVLMVLAATAVARGFFI
jgi:putative membrane protein